MTLEDIKLIERMCHSKIENYAIPGLSSSLVGGTQATGKVRFFESSRNHQEPIVPHNHRFSFVCIVLRGKVVNRIWESSLDFGIADLFQESILHYDLGPGKYRVEKGETSHWVYRDEVYKQGDSYSMTADQVHSIFFSKDAKVLFFEGPAEHPESLILEPVVNGKTIPTFKVEPWMFERQ